MAIFGRALCALKESFFVATSLTSVSGALAAASCLGFAGDTLSPEGAPPVTLRQSPASGGPNVYCSCGVLRGTAAARVTEAAGAQERSPGGGGGGGGATHDCAYVEALGGRSVGSAWMTSSLLSPVPAGCGLRHIGPWIGALTCGELSAW